MLWPSVSLLLFASEQHVLGCDHPGQTAQCLSGPLEIKLPKTPNLPLPTEHDTRSRSKFKELGGRHPDGVTNTPRLRTKRHISE